MGNGGMGSRLLGTRAWGFRTQVNLDGTSALVLT